MQFLKQEIREVKEFQEKVFTQMHSDFKELNGNVHKMSENMASITSELRGHKDLYRLQVEGIVRDQALIREQVGLNSKAIADVSKDLNGAKGAAAMARILWGVAWTIGTSAVAAAVWIMTN